MKRKEVIDPEEVRLNQRDKRRLALERQLNNGTDIMELIDQTGESFIDLMGNLTGIKE